MKHRLAIAGMGAIAAGSISACGGGNGQAMTTTMPPPPAAATQSVDTVQVLAQARQVSETGSPYPVNEGALVLTDTSDATEPVSVNGS